VFAAGTLLAFFGDRTGTLAGIATVGLDLPKSGHGAPAAIIGFLLRFRGPLGNRESDGWVAAGDAVGGRSFGSTACARAGRVWDQRAAATA
jgi:hypothetical protein